MFKTEFLNNQQVAIFDIQGHISLDATAALRKAFWEAINTYPLTSVVLNFQKVPKIDSTIVSLLVATKNVVARIHADLILIGLQPGHQAFLERLNLHHYFQIFPDLETFLNQPTP